MLRFLASGSLLLLALAVAVTGRAMPPVGAATTRGPVPRPAPSPADRERLGRLLFLDTGLSEPRGTSCASCHDPRRAFSGNHGSTIGVALGSRPGMYGIRNTPSLTYASFSPQFSVETEGDKPEPVGGQFLDGRVDFLDEQALLPLLSPTEMNNADRATVVAKVAAAAYAGEFRAVWGAQIFTRVDAAIAAIGSSLEAFESGAAFHPFSSRFDRHLAGTLVLDAAEQRGMALFFAPERGNCFACHDAKPWIPGTVALFSDFSYEALGVPRNRAIPADADAAWFDLGLGGPQRALPVGDAALRGSFKTPSLRNVAVKQAFMHNGRFTRLEDVVAFYATRDTDPGRWYPQGEKFDDLPLASRGNVNTGDAPYRSLPGGTPRLGGQDILDLVAFLRALTDREFIAALPPFPITETVPGR